MLVVDNPTGDLAGAQNEGDQLAALYEANRGMVKTLKGADATRANVLAELASGLHDILHYAGHADFVETSPEESGLILRDGRLTAADLAKVETAPQMIFLNACQSGRMRGAPGKPTIDVRRSTFAGHRSRTRLIALDAGPRALCPTAHETVRERCWPPANEETTWSRESPSPGLPLALRLRSR